MFKVILVILACTLFTNAPAHAQDRGCGPRQTSSFRTIDVVSYDVMGGVQPLDSARLGSQVQPMLSSDQREDRLLNGALIGGALGGAAGIYVFRGWSAFAGNDPGTKETITGFIIGGALGASIGMLIDALF